MTGDVPSRPYCQADHISKQAAPASPGIIGLTPGAQRDTLKVTIAGPSPAWCAGALLLPGANCGAVAGAGLRLRGGSGNDYGLSIQRHFALRCVSSRIGDFWTAGACFAFTI